MVSLTVLFGMLVALFAIIGAMRGWAKELLVTSRWCSGFLNAILTITSRPTDGDVAAAAPDPVRPARRRALLLAISATRRRTFGPRSPSWCASVEEILLGLVLGALNGYLLIGSLFFYLDQTGYPTSLIIAPAADSALRAQIDGVMKWVPPSLLPIPQIYFAVGVVFVFIIVVFV
jgi:hypothetical protein